MNSAVVFDLGTPKSAVRKCWSLVKELTKIGPILMTSLLIIAIVLSFFVLSWSLSTGPVKTGFCLLIKNFN